MASIHDLLRPITLTKVVSRVAASTQTLLQLFQMHAGGSKCVYMGHGREGSYHVYDNVRTVGIGRAPGTAAGRRARSPIARVPFTYARMHEQISLLAEELHNLSKIDDPRMRDEAGQSYIKMQTRTVAQRAGNWRTALLVGMLRDSLYVHLDGDNWYFDYTPSNAAFRINFNMPSGNKNQLNMTGAGDIIDVPWSDPTANIPLHLQKINAAFQQLNGGRLGLVILPAVSWNYITNNDYVASQAGIANAPFQTFERQVGVGPDGTPINAHFGRLNCAPGVEFHITNDGLELGAPGEETWTQHVEDNKAVFCVAPNESDALAMYEGSEPIAEYDNGPKTIKVGLQSWSKESSNPTSTEIFALDNAMTVNHVPSSVAYATIAGF